MSDNSQVLALKYRPRRFEDLIGQQTISQTLSLALDSNRLSHAYLLSGLRGSGKTSTARIMAKSLLCSSGPTSKPCENCDNCLSANSSRHLDIIEMDAASNRGIDDIKDLIEHTKYKPNSARFKVFIIDEVHMLTPQAFNALLKTLEEPPGFVKFILATTDPLKLPATILSRTQHFRFKRISDTDVMHHLSHILHQENVDFEQDALRVLTRSGQGSLRDTLTLMDQAIIFSKGKITTAGVTQMLGLLDPAFLDELYDLILNSKDFRPVLNTLQEYEATLVIDEMSIYLKDKMIDLDPKFDILLYDRFFRIFGDAKQLLSINSDSGFVLILMLSKMIEATKLKTVDEIISQVENIHVTANVPNVAVATSSQTPAAVVQKTEPVQVVSNVEKPKEIVQKEESQTPISQEKQTVEIVSEPIVEEVVLEPVQEVVEAISQPINEGFELYTTLIESIYEKNHDLGSCFEENFVFNKHENNHLLIDTYAQDECREMLGKYWPNIKMIILAVFGEETSIDFEKKQRVEEPQTIHAPTPVKIQETQEDQSGSMIEDIEMHQSSGCVASMGDVQPSSQNLAQKETQIQDILNSPMLNKAKELFDPKKITVKSKT
ncbi:MAG: DNA polymerase III subunit gamma/tau [Campylobacterota bacterium]|nr:DNA polymerase III subunit gamma/tau [Campylobacterota bacterium]